MANNQAIMDAALKLPRKNREDLYELLLESLINPEIALAGAKVAHSRMQAYRRGEIGGKPAKEVLNQIRARKQMKQ